MFLLHARLHSHVSHNAVLYYEIIVDLISVIFELFLLLCNMFIFIIHYRFSYHSQFRVRFQQATLAPVTFTLAVHSRDSHISGTLGDSPDNHG